MANVTIDVAAQFKGKKAFDDAGKSVSGLESVVGKLAKTFAGVFAAKKIIDFGKASVKAFMEDQKSAAILTNTVKNLGLAFEMPRLDDFINKLSQSAGVADDVLRPALQSLLTTTGSAIKSQELLTQAIDISRGSSIDLSTVVQDLNNAFVGNTKGLKKYNLGLTQAELKTMSFTDVQKRLTKQFTGSSAAYLETYAGKMEILNTAAGEAKETIGKGLVDALMLISGDTTVSTLATDMQDVAQFTSDAAYGFGVLISKIGTLNGVLENNVLTDFIKVAAQTSGIGLLSKLGASSRPYVEDPNSLQARQHNAYQNAAARKKAEEDAAKRAKEILKAQQAAAKLTKQQTQIKKSQGILDIQQIGLVAALKGQLSEQDRKSAELQLALLNGNDAVAAKLTEQILKAQDATGSLSKFVADLGNVKITDPFTAWYKTLDDVQQKMAAIQLQAQGVAINPNISTNVPQSPITQMPSAVLAQASADYQAGQQTIKLMVEGGDEVTSLMRFKILESSMSGSQAQIDRTLGAFDR